jgi:antitoxin VapB
MGVVASKTFKSGNSIAVRLPKTIAFPADTPVTIERHGDTLTIRPAIDAAAQAGFDAQMAEARAVMEKRRLALRELAK